MTDGYHNRMKEIKDVHHRFADAYKIGGGVMLVLIGVWIGSLLFTEEEVWIGSSLFTKDYGTNLYTEILSIFVTVFVLDRLQEWRKKEQRKETLTREASSRDNSTALSAIDWLRAENWLTIHDETPLLRGKELVRANLHNGDLSEADLEETVLYKADLSKATLYSADLSKATLDRAKFYDAYLDFASLDGASLWEADFRQAYLDFASLDGASLDKADFRQATLIGAILNGASLYEADFRQAVLWNASLRGARYIETALFDEGTVLPNAKPLFDENDEFMKNDAGDIIFDAYWTPDTDMTRYTDPDHPDFWQPDSMRIGHLRQI